MASSRLVGWKNDEVYYEPQVRACLDKLGIQVLTETETNFLALCPFHNNNNSPSFSVSKDTGLFLCFNPACGHSGNLIQLIEQVQECTWWEAKRMLDEMLEGFDLVVLSQEAFLKRQRELEEPEYPDFPQEALDRLSDGLKAYPAAQDYMIGRGFTEDTLDFFETGYSYLKNMVTVPIHDPMGNPVGVVGRAIDKKEFKYSYGLPKNKLIFNLHRAKRESSTVIVVESSMDVMRLHQSGFPNSVALLGGKFSTYQEMLLRKAFNEIVIFTDSDDAGRELGYKIQSSLTDKRVSWVAHSPSEVFPHGAKDVGDLTEDEIRNLVRNAINPILYQQWYN